MSGKGRISQILCGNSLSPLNSHAATHGAAVLNFVLVAILKYRKGTKISNFLGVSG